MNNKSLPPIFYNKLSLVRQKGLLFHAIMCVHFIQLCVCILKVGGGGTNIVDPTNNLDPIQAGQGNRIWLRYIYRAVWLIVVKYKWVITMYANDPNDVSPRLWHLQLCDKHSNINVHQRLHESLTNYLGNLCGLSINLLFIWVIEFYGPLIGYGYAPQVCSNLLID